MKSVVGRLGQWCYHRRWLVVAVWAGVLVAGVVAGGLVTERLSEQGVSQRIESSQGLDVLQRATNSSGQVFGVIDDIDVGAPGVQTAVQAAADDLAKQSGVRQVQSPYASGLADDEAKALTSKDHRAVLVVVTLARLEQGPRTEAVAAIDARLHRLVADLRAAGEPEAAVRLGGDPAAAYQFATAHEVSIRRGEGIALPITLVVMVLVFGSLLAGFLPLVTAIVSAGSAMLVVLGFTYVTKVDDHVLSHATILGLALSIDYALLLVGRYREELFDGHAPDLAVARAWATAGRTIVFSSFIMAAALSGLLFFDDTTLRGIGAGGISVAAVAAGVALTFTAAVLAMAGRRIKPAPPATHGKQSFQLIPAQAFAKIAAAVQRRPVAFTVVTLALLFAATAPALTGAMRLSGLKELAPNLEAVHVDDELTTRFGQPKAAAVTVLARTDPATLDRWAERFKTDPAVKEVRTAQEPAPGLAVLDIATKSDDTQSEQTTELVRRLRTDRPAGAQSWVMGDAANLIDFSKMLTDGLPKALAVMLLAMFVLLFAMTGSLVVPLKAVLANVLSLGATVGILNLVFVQGFLAKPLGLSTSDGLNPLIVLPVLILAFAFSVDYEVFLISRIRERVERDGDLHDADSARLKEVTDIAVREGLQHTGRIITSAALLMAIVFIGFAAGTVATLQQVGVGLAAAIIIDATIVRCLLVPASMTLMGQWNWWAPAPLKKLHARFGLHEHVLPAAAPEPRPTTT